MVACKAAEKRDGKGGFIETEFDGLGIRVAPAAAHRNSQLLVSLQSCSPLLPTALTTDEALHTVLGLKGQCAARVCKVEPK